MRHFTEQQDTCPDCGSNHLTDPAHTSDGVTTCKQCEMEWTCDAVEFEPIEDLEVEEFEDMDSLVFGEAA